MNRTDTWMPLYVGDYLRDTGHLTTEEHGAYMLLLMQAWVRDGLLPIEQDRLRMLARMEPKAWKRSADTLLAFFTRTPDGYRHKRVDQEIAATLAAVEQRRAAGKASAEARAKQRRGSEGDDEPDPGGQGKGNGPGNGNPTTVATESAPDGARNGRPSQSQSQEEAVAARRLRISDPEHRWEAATGKAEVDNEMRRRAVAGGSYIREAAEEVCKAARINDAAWRGDWRPLIAWLEAGFTLHDDILPVIQRVAARPGYHPPTSLKFFDAAIREAARAA